MPAGTGTPGTNQNGPLAAPAYSPGEIVTAAGPLSINAPAPVVDITLGSQFVTKAYDLAVYPALRPELIFDQFATVRATNTTHRGGSLLTTDTTPVVCGESLQLLGTTPLLRASFLMPRDAIRTWCELFSPQPSWEGIDNG